TDAIIALPLLPLLIVLAALDLHKLGLPERVIQSDEISVIRIVALAVLVGWTTAARLVRGATLVTRNRDFVRAARSLGAGVPHILWLHILPNVLGPVIVAMTLSAGAALGPGDVSLIVTARRSRRGGSAVRAHRRRSVRAGRSCRGR